MLHQAYTERGVAGMHIGYIAGVYFIHLLHKQPKGFPEYGEGCAAALLQLQHYGAIDKTTEGFQMVIKRCSLHSRACSEQVLTPSPETEPCAFQMYLSMLMPFVTLPTVLEACALKVER